MVICQWSSMSWPSLLSWGTASKICFKNIHCRTEIQPIRWRNGNWELLPPFGACLLGHFPLSWQDGTQQGILFWWGSTFLTKNNSSSSTIKFTALKCTVRWDFLFVFCFSIFTRLCNHHHWLVPEQWGWILTWIFEWNINQRLTLIFRKFALKLWSPLQGKLQFLFKYHFYKAK